jgi:hypothetical protein
VFPSLSDLSITSKGRKSRAREKIINKSFAPLFPQNQGINPAFIYALILPSSLSPKRKEGLKSPFKRE